jgi:hypothetical protein
MVDDYRQPWLSITMTTPTIDAVPAARHASPTLDEAIAVAHAVVWSTVTTVDGAGRPRARVLHPIWVAVGDDIEGWVTTRRTPVKVGHLASNPHVSCAYLAADHDVAFFDCTARWVDDRAGRRRAWDAFTTVPPPAGYDPATIFPDGPGSPAFAALHLRPYRIQVARGDALARGERPALWRRAPRG